MTQCPSLSFTTSSTPDSLFCRFVGCPGRSHGQALLPQMPRRVHPQVIPTPPYRRRLLWYRFPTHVLHGAPGVPPQATTQPVCTKVSIFCLFGLAVCEVCSSNQDLFPIKKRTNQQKIIIKKKKVEQIFNHNFAVTCRLFGSYFLCSGEIENTNLSNI